MALIRVVGLSGERAARRDVGSTCVGGALPGNAPAATKSRGRLRHHNLRRTRPVAAITTVPIDNHLCGLALRPRESLPQDEPNVARAMQEFYTEASTPPTVTSAVSSPVDVNAAHVRFDTRRLAARCRAREVIAA